MWCKYLTLKFRTKVYMHDVTMCMVLLKFTNFVLFIGHSAMVFTNCEILIHSNNIKFTVT
jgi:hypothetical protein